MIRVITGGQEFSVKGFTFSGGERQVSVPGLPGMGVRTPMDVVARVHSPDELIDLLMIGEIVRRLGVPRFLMLPYFPYARQDRVMASEEAFSLRVAAAMICAMGFEQVVTYDAHSDVLPALVPTLRLVDQVAILREFWEVESCLEHCDAVVAPDAGAAKKAVRVAAWAEKPLICASKVRDVATGEICGVSIGQASVPERVFIIDDLCDGGATFVGLATELRARGAREVYLYVTHGIFSKGLSVFDGLIDTIYCTDSFWSMPVLGPPDNLIVKKVGASCF